MPPPPARELSPSRRALRPFNPQSRPLPDREIDRARVPGLPSDSLMRPRPHASARRPGRLLLPAMLLACFALAAAAMPRADRHAGRRAIDHLEETWRTAILHGNAAAMESLLADDYMGITPNGTLQSKDQTLASLRSGTLKITRIDFTDRKVRFYGTTAIVTCRAEVTGSSSDGALNGAYRYTRVYARDARGLWRIVSFEASRIGDSLPSDSFHPDRPDSTHP